MNEGEVPFVYHPVVPTTSSLNYTKMINQIDFFKRDERGSDIYEY